MCRRYMRDPRHKSYIRYTKAVATGERITLPLLRSLSRSSTVLAADSVVVNKDKWGYRRRRRRRGEMQIARQNIIRGRHLNWVNS